MKSVWTDSVTLPHFEKLQGKTKTDVLIIGGGLAGVLTAYFLKQRGVNYTLVEAKSVGLGITKNTTAKVTSQHGLIYDKLYSSVGIEKAKMYLQANEKALAKYKDLAKNIDCDFVEMSNFVYSMNDKSIIGKEVDTVNKLGFKAEYVEKMPLPVKPIAAIEFKNQAQFNPLKFMAGIAEGLNIYENTFVKEIDKHTAITTGGNITANKIIVATHFPFINSHGSYFLKMYQDRSYLIALKNAPDLNGMYVDEAQKGMTFRNYQDLLILGGGDHRTGKEGGRYQELRDFAKKHFPEAHESYAWSNQDCMTLDGVPYIGHYSSMTPDLYVATGFNKWGMTSSMVSAMLLTDMIIGQKPDYAEVYSPHRSMLKPQLFINGFESIVNLLAPTGKRCPHMGCALKYNKTENTWECPCHGSRFDQDGRLIDNPAMRDKDIKSD